MADASRKSWTYTIFYSLFTATASGISLAIFGLTMRVVWEVFMWGWNFPELITKLIPELLHVWN